MNHDIKMRIEGEGKAPQDFHFKNEREFCLLAITEGKPILLGRMPLKTVHRELREFATDWAYEQDLSELEATVRGCGSQSPWGVLLNQKNISSIGSMITGTCQKPDFRAWRVLWVFIKPLLIRLQQEIRKPITEWQFNPLPAAINAKVCGWLFRR